MLIAYFLNNDFRKKLILFIETTLSTLPFTKISLKSSGSFISEKMQSFLSFNYIIYINKNIYCSAIKSLMEF